MLRSNRSQMFFRPTTLSKRDSNADVFLQNLRNFQEHLLYNIPVPASMQWKSAWMNPQYAHYIENYVKYNWIFPIYSAIFHWQFSFFLLFLVNFLMITLILLPTKSVLKSQKQENIFSNKNLKIWNIVV